MGAYCNIRALSQRRIRTKRQVRWGCLFLRLPLGFPEEHWSCIVKTEFLYGFHPVFEALKAGKRDFLKVYIAHRDKGSKRTGKIESLVKERCIPFSKVKPSYLDSITGNSRHQGVGADVGPYPVIGFSDMLENQEYDNVPLFILLLDSIMDPHNLGAMIRTGLCAGINGMVILKNRSASPTPAVSKASAGALEHINLARVTNMVSTIKTLKKNGFWILGMDKQADKSVFSFDFTEHVAVVIGGEEKGIRELVKTHCDHMISIPQTGRINSLNASVSAAVVMYEALRQKTVKKMGFPLHLKV
jgi:23S rRNA (guanosine2251-2'-O)-methyltransferase